MPRIYIETSIFSFYVESRQEPEMVARKHWTRYWLDQARTDGNDLVTSLAVQNELEAGNYPGKEEALNLIENFRLLDIGTEVAEVVEAYVNHQVMPADPGGDALHVALAAYYQCDFLVTWNCRHIANANKFEHIRRVNAIVGVWNPSLVTPLELLKWEAFDE